MTTAVVKGVRFAPILVATTLTILLLWLLGKTADVFILLFLAVLISLYLGAVAEFFIVRARLPRRAAFMLAVIVSLAMLAGLLWLLVPPVVEQTQQLVQVLPNYLESWEQGIDRIAARFPASRDYWQPGQHRVLHVVYEQLSGQFQNVVPRVFSLVHGAISIFSVAVMGLYLALYPGIYREWLIALFPPIHRDLIRDVLGDLGVSLRAFIVGQLLAMAILGALTAVLLYFLDVPYALTFGVFTGVAAIVPFFGSLLSTLLPAAFVLAGPHGGTRALLVIAAGVVVHLFEGNLVGPYIMSKKIELPPVLTIMAVLVVGKLLGGLGLLIAVPLLAVIMVVVRRILINRLYEGQGFRRSARDRLMVLRVPAPEGGVIFPASAPPDVLSFDLLAGRTA